MPCFLDGSDYAVFKDILWESAESAGCEIHAALMLPNAYWVLASSDSADGISRFIQRTGRCYVRHCNGKYRREGTLWAGRYKACLVQPKEAYMQQCAAFLLQTPVRCGVVTRGGQWPWCFLQFDYDAGDAACPETVYSEISVTLNMGLVLGSEEFCRYIAKSEGIRTSPGMRGRPRKNRQANLTEGS